VRANYRIAYDRLPTFGISSTIGQNLPGIAIAQTLQPGGRLRNLAQIQPPTQTPNVLRQPPAFSLNNITVVDPNLQMPQTHQWGLSIQRELFARTVLEVNYIGRRGHNLFGAYNANQPELTRNGFLDAFRTVAAGGDSPLINTLLGADSRRNATETGSQFMRRQFPTELANGAAGTVAQNLATRVQGGRALPDLAGLGSFFFLRFPQFANAVNVIDSNDFSTYHGLEFQVERRYTNGLSWQVGYTLSKSLDTRSFDPSLTIVSTGSNQQASSTPFDIGNRRLNYAYSDFDRRHALQSYWTWELPFAKNAGPWMKRAAGGWSINGFTTIQSGRPFTVFSGFNTFSSVVQSTANCANCTRDFGQVRDEGGLQWYFSPQERSSFQPVRAGEIGGTGRNFFRGPGSFNLDMALIKRTAITERFNLELRADATNLTNTPTYGFPTAVANSATFGRIRDTILSQSRKFQVGVKLHF
jgi:hypothetical protein